MELPSNIQAIDQQVFLNAALKAPALFHYETVL
jgi:hypothetical protein